MSNRSSNLQARPSRRSNYRRDRQGWSGLRTSCDL